MAENILSTLRRRVAKAPEEPGIYKWLNADGDVLYVGKAKNLRARLRSYVQKNADKGQGPWKQSFLRQITDFDVTVVNTELEALVLETNLIKQLRPKYNVMMKDDKNYVYVEVTVEDPYPRVVVERRMSDSHAKYFGPFLSAWETRQTLDMLQEIFHYRACRESLQKLNKASDPGTALASAVPCLDHQIGQCCGTCAGVISREEYNERIAQVLHFFRGDYKPVIAKGKELMHEAAAQKKFERAAKMRDMLAIIESLQERQLVSDTSGEDADVIGVALLAGKVQVMVFHKRNGKLIGEQQFALSGSADTVSDVLDQFLPQYYEGAADIPDVVLIGDDFPGRSAFAAFLSMKRGKKVQVKIPERGNKSHLLELAEKNAHQKAKQAEASWEADQRNTANALQELASLLELPSSPTRIEGYDISHTGGTETVGSMVVVVNGKPKNEHYRSFTIHSMQRGAVDDYRALKEVLTRRLRHIAGGLKYEGEEWASAGVTVGKARKADAANLQQIVHAEDDEAFDHTSFSVARHDEEIIAAISLRALSATSYELHHLWVNESYTTQKLGSFMVRNALHSLKKGKVYACVELAHEQEYGTLGFRHLLKAPKGLQKKVNAETELLMVYDTTQHKTDSSLSTAPDLIVIDGGKGQLNVGVEVLKHFNLTIPVIGLAKREEEVFVPGKPVSVLFPKDSPAKFLLMRLRDEAHRFANRHRSKRALKTALTSQLDRIPGIGPETKNQLLQTFGSVDGIKRAPDEKLLEVLSEEQVRAVRELL